MMERESESDSESDSESESKDESKDESKSVHGCFVRSLFCSFVYSFVRLYYNWQ